MPSQDDSDIASNGADIWNPPSSINQVPVETQEGPIDVAIFGARPPSQFINGESNRTRARRKLIKRFSKLNEMRQDVLGMRLEATESRIRLRRERQIVGDIDEEVIQRLRLVVLNNDHGDLTHVLDSLEELQEARGKLRPMEDDYNRLEHQLNTKEFNLKEFEERTYHQNDSSHASLLADDEFPPLERNHVPTHSILSTQASYEQQEGRGDGILSRIADADLLRNRLRDLEWELTKLYEEERFRTEMGESLDDEARKELCEFRLRYDEVYQKLEAIEISISRMKVASFYLGRCNEEETVGHSGRDDMQDSEIVLDTYDEDDDHYRGSGPVVGCRSQELPPGQSFHVWGNRNPIDFRIFDIDPLLHSVWESRPIFDSVAVNRRRDAVDRSSYINTWILDGLQSSKLEVLQYRYHTMSANLDPCKTDLKNFALKWWHEDLPGSDEHLSGTTPAEGHFSLLTTKTTHLNPQTQTDPDLPNIVSLSLTGREADVSKSAIPQDPSIDANTTYG